jgi:hypothetical protein
MSVIHPIIKGRLARTLEFQNFFRFNILVLVGIIVGYALRIEIPNIAPGPQSLWIIKVLELPGNTSSESRIGFKLEK